MVNNDANGAGWSSSLLSYNSSPVVTNTIFWGNNVPGLLLTAGGSPVVTYSTMDGGVVSGTQNNGLDPLFVNSTSDFHLGAGSPSINTGNNSAQGVGTFDLDGNPRLNGTVDRGAYEY